MKKLFPGILALLMAFGMMVGCGEKPADSSTPAGSTPPASTPDTSTPDDSTPDEDSPLYALESVKEVLNGSMIQKNVETRKDYTVANQWYSWHADETFDIAWTVTDAAGNATTNVTIVEGDGDYDTVKVNTDLSEDFTYILTGTISDSQGQSVQISFTRKVLKGGQYLPVAITEKPTEQTAYKLYVYQSTNAKDCYFTGNMNGYYFETTEDESAAVDLFVEYIANSDNFNVYFMDASNVKQYIGVKLSADGAHDNIVFETTPSSSFAWNAELGTITTHLDVNKNGEAADYYFGNYSTHMTFSASMLSYAGGAGNNVGGLVTMVHKDDIKVPDADKIAAVKESLSVQLNHTLDKEVTLKTADDRYSDVSISWSVEADKGATVANDKLNLVIPAAATEVVLTATISCGNASEEVSFTLVLGPKTVAPDATNADAIIAAAYSLAAGETLPGGNYTLTGEITKVNTAYDSGYGNITVTITIGDKTFECYRLVSGAAEVNELKVGDVITVTGPIKNYNGKVEFDKGCVLDAIVEGEVGGDDTPDSPDTPDTPATPSQADIVNAAYALEQGAALEGTKTLTGVISSIDENYNSQYKNVTVTIIIDNMTDKPIKCYRLKGTGAELIGVGFTITVSGTIKNYNGTIEFDTGCTLDSYIAHPCSEYTEATCKGPASCTVCGTAQAGSSAVACVFVDGACKWCSAPEGVAVSTATLSFADKANRTAFDTNQQVWEQNGITLTNDKGSSTSNVADYSAPARFYKSSTITVEGPGKITKIEFKANSASYATALQNSIVAAAGVTVSVDGSTVTVVFAEAVDSFVIESLTGGQVRMDSVTVSYLAE